MRSSLFAFNRSRATLLASSSLMVALLLQGSGPAHAETKVGFRQLGSTVPIVVQRGKTSEIQIRSNFTLNGAYKVLFDPPGMTAVPLETEPIDAPRRGRGQPGTPFRFSVDVPADQLPGVYEYRVATRTAVSSVAHLLVTELPVVPETKEENGRPDVAQPVDLNSAIAGTCEKTEDVDCFRFAVTEGQTVTFNLFAQRVTEAVHSMQSGNGTYLMDPILTLTTTSGQVIRQNDNFFGGDAFLAHTFQQAGEYVVSVRDARYIGNTKYVYCLEVSDQPHVHAVHPLGIQRGMSVPVQMAGHALGESAETIIDTSAEDVTTGWQPMVLETDRGTTNPVSVLVSDRPQMIATDGHHPVEAAEQIPVNCGINGRLTAADQVHRFRFTAVKNQYYKFDVMSSRLRLPLDAVLEIHDASGKKLADADDGTQTKDPTLYFKAPADGEYIVSLRDLHDRGGQRFLYHLQCESSGPDFELHGEYYYAQIAPGTRMAWFARLKRLNGFDGPVEIVVEGLPPGVSYEPVTIPTGMDHCLINLAAEDGAAIDASLVKVAGVAKVATNEQDTRTLKRYGRITCELQTQGGGQARWPIRTSIVGVVEPLDLLSVTADPAELTLKRGGQASFKLKIVRNKDFKEPVTLAMSFLYFKTSFGNQLPPGVTMAGASTGRLSGDTLEGTIVLEASNKALLVERLPVAGMARVPITFSITTNYASNPVYLTVVE